MTEKELNEFRKEISHMPTDELRILLTKLQEQLLTELNVDKVRKQ